MTKDGLTEVVLNTGRVGTKVAAREIVDSVFGAMSEALRTGDEMNVAGFGTFRVKQRKARTCWNPRTREPVAVPARKAVSFGAARALKDEVNAGGKGSSKKGKK